MDQLKDFADKRLVNGCIYCGGSEETREHVPSKILLEKPYPTNLPIMKACFACNNSFSQDEEYVACLIECMLAGSTDLKDIYNSRIANKLSNNPFLFARIRNSTRIVNNAVVFSVESERLNNVVKKLAIGHAAYELSKIMRHEPTSLSCWLISDMTDEERDAYDSVHVTDLIGEIGSRNMQRLLTTEITLMAPTGELKRKRVIIDDWVEVQEGRYRYHGIDHAEGVIVKIIFSEILACQVYWKENQ